MHDFPGGSVVKNLAGNAGDCLPIQGLVLVSGRSSGEGNGNLLQHCHAQRRLVGYSPGGQTELDITEQLTLSFF